MHSLEEARSLTGLGAYDVNDVFEIFAEARDANGQISMNAFERTFSFVVQLAGGLEEEARSAAAVRRIFELFDTEGTRFINFEELACGLSVLAGGSMDSKVLAAFRLLGDEQTGTISLVDFTTYIRSVFRIMFEAQPELKSRMGSVTADELAAVTVEQCFEDADLDDAGNLVFEQFKEWCLNTM